VPIDAASEALLSYNCYEQSIILGYPTAIHVDIVFTATISTEANTPSNQVTQDDWKVMQSIECYL